MPTRRTYADACGIARALDVVGERWALLVVRELLLGPQRFADLRRALPRASSNLVTDRLRELAGHGVVHRRRLDPPGGPWAYELTARGRELEPIVLALGDWGVRAAMPPVPTTLSATSVLLFLRAAARPGPADPPTVYRLALDDRVWSVRTAPGEVVVDAGDVTGADASLHTTPGTLNALLEDPATLDAALTDGRARATGDLSALRRLLRAAAGPYP